MSTELPQDRSPRYPRSTLAASIEDVRKLYKAVGKGKIDPLIASRALGFGGLNGAAQATLGTLAQYSLVERAAGQVGITPLALRILHPMSDAQRDEAIREAALSPKIFQELFEKFPEANNIVIESYLAQNAFTSDGAKKAAKIFASNRETYNVSAPVLADNKLEGSDETDRLTSPSPKSSPDAKHSVSPSVPNTSPSSFFSLSPADNSKMLAQYSIPLGANQATLVFTGHSLSVEDFDALLDFVEFARKQFARKEKARNVAPPPQLKLSERALRVRGILATRKALRFTFDEAVTNVVEEDHDLDHDFMMTWRELLRERAIVIVNDQEPKLFSLAENA